MLYEAAVLKEIEDENRKRYTGQGIFFYTVYLYRSLPFPLTFPTAGHVDL